MVMPVPAYAPQLDIAQLTGRERADLVRRPGRRAGRDRPRPAGLAVRSPGRARCCSPSRTTRGGTCSPAPSSRASATSWSRHGARVISDEIHAPLVLPGAEHVSYLSLDGTADHAVAARRREQGVQHRGLRCAQIIAPDEATRKALLDAPMAAQRLLVAAGRGRLPWRRTRTATRGWPPWSSGSTSSARSSASCSREHLPEARMRPLEGDLPGVARPAGLRPRRPRRRRADPRSGAAVRRATTTSPGSTATSG